MKNKHKIAATMLAFMVGYLPTSPTLAYISHNDWKIYRRTSPIDDSTNVYLTLEGSNIAGRFIGSVIPKLHIDCRENRTHVYINFGGHFMSDYQYGTVTYRIDSLTAQKRKFKESTDNEALGLWHGRE